MLDNNIEDDRKWVDGVKKAMNIGLVNQTDHEIRFNNVTPSSWMPDRFLLSRLQGDMLSTSNLLPVDVMAR